MRLAKDRKIATLKIAHETDKDRAKRLRDKRLRQWRRTELMNNREYAKRLTYCWHKSKKHFANLSDVDRAETGETVTNEAQG